MKNKLTTIVLFICGLLTIKAQKISIGFEAGPNLSHIINKKETPFSTYYERNPSVRYCGGLSLQYHFNDKNILRISSLYERRGLWEEITTTDMVGNSIGQSKQVYVIESIAFPIMYRRAFNKLFLDGGITLSYLIRDITKTEMWPDYIYKYDKNHLGKGLCLGIGYTFISTDKISLNCALKDHLDFTPFDLKKFKNNGIYNVNTVTLLFGISYKLGKKESATSR